MPNLFGKSRKPNDPYAIYKALGIEWRVLKTYKQPSSEAKDHFARWFVAGYSDATFGGYDMGYTYAWEIKAQGILVAATPEWQEAYGTRKIPTPTEYLNQKETA